MYLIQIPIGRSHNFGQGVDLWPWMGVDSEEVHLLGLSQRLHCRSQNLHQLQRLETQTNDLRGKFSSSHFAAQKNRGSVRKAGVYSTYPQGGLHYVFIAVYCVCDLGQVPIAIKKLQETLQQTCEDSDCDGYGGSFWGMKFPPRMHHVLNLWSVFFSGSIKPPKVLNQKTLHVMESLQ